MTFEELKNALLAADPAAVLVSRRLLARILHLERRLPSQFGRIPHQDSYIIDRHVLFKHIEQADLNVESDRLLPPTVILLTQPTAEQLHQWGRENTLLYFWQRLFHANVHLALEREIEADRLTPGVIQQRIDEIGHIEFKEIRTVLQQENLLLPRATDDEVYIEFAAVYLEQRYFLMNLREVFFPAIRDFGRIDNLLAKDVDADELFARTRLEAAPDPVIRVDRSSDEPNDSYWRLVREAERLARAGNSVRSAILRTRAAGIAPSALTLSTRNAAIKDLQQLAPRLQNALKLPDTERDDWLRALPPLLEKADHSHWSPEARLLYDLQKVCVDSERDLYALDLVEWVLSVGKRPIKRPLPSQRLVRIAKHLGSAAQRLPMVRVSDNDRQLLTTLLQSAQQQSEERMRVRFRPILNDAFYDVGFQPHNPPEQTAFAKMIEELLDRISRTGFFTFSDLRDAISRNNLKLPDIADPQEFIVGDPLLRLDRRLAASLDGVYRPSEIYLRLLQRITSLNFGTETGRRFTQYVTAPFGGALVLLEGLYALFHLIQKLGGPVVPMFGPLSSLVATAWPAADKPPDGTPMPVTGWILFFVLGSLFLCLLHVPLFRQKLARAVRKVYRFGRRILVEIPREMLPLELMRQVWGTWSFQLFYWLLFKPVVVCALIFWLRPTIVEDPYAALIVFLAVSFLLNSRWVQAASQLTTHALVQVYDWLRADLFQNLFRLIVYFFKRVTDTVEYVLYTVDEWLRFRSGDTWLSMTTRALLGLAWFPISYLARIYILVLIEPMLNPIKLPITLIAAKITVPLCAMFGTEVARLVLPIVVVPAFANLIGAMHAWLFPDVFGFLFWEIRENWRLYRANRPETLHPVAIGDHGESMMQLLRPGFHSGTLPRLFAHLRWAERSAQESGNWHNVRAYRHSLHENEEAIRLFVERELLNLLHQHPGWRERPLSVGNISLASNRIAVELRHLNYPDEPLILAFELQAHWLVASAPTQGWLRYLTPEQFSAFITAVAGLYKLAGVELIREQIQANLPAGVRRYEITDHGLVFRLDQPDGAPIVCNLMEDQRQLRPREQGAEPQPALPALDVRQFIFARLPLTWEQWVANWGTDAKSQAALQSFQMLLGASPVALAAVPEKRLPTPEPLRNGALVPLTTSETH